MTLLLVLALLQQGGPSLDPDLAGMLARVPPPRRGRPSVFNVVSTNRVVAGDQLNVLTAAWLPRSLRLRLRQAPTLTPPGLTGVWATPRGSIPGAVATWEGEDDTYDLFVGPQTVYPLNPGSLTIPPARLSWLEPARRSSGEDRYETAQSTALVIQVSQLPVGGRPPQFAGPVARELRIGYRLGAGAGRAGAVLPVEVILTGAGSLGLWPAPGIAWPPGVRAYDQGTEIAFEPSGARLGGTRRFRFAVVPDSAGGLSLPPIEYPYFDPVTSSYRVARTARIVVPILEPAPVGDRRSPVPIVTPGAPPLAVRIVRLPGYVLWLLGLLPFGLIGGLAWRRRPRPNPQPPPADPAERLGALVLRLLPPGTGAERRALVGALRNAGLASEPATRLVELHLAVEAARYGPRQRDGAFPASLLREIERALDRVPGRIRRIAGLASLAFVLLGVRPGSAPAQTGIELYTGQEYAAAAEAFRVEAEQQPSPGRWYNLAAAEYLNRRDAHAAAALLAARAADPRDPRVRTLWTALAREHSELRQVPRSWPLSAEECFALALLACWAAVPLYLFLGRRRMLWGLGLVLAAGLAALGQLLRSEHAGRRAVLIGGASLRISPHGLAPARGGVPAFRVVQLSRQSGGWWLVRADGSTGWVPAEILVESPALH